jgi:hypothetical protein
MAEATVATSKRLELVEHLTKLTQSSLECVMNPPFDLGRLEFLTHERQEFVTAISQLSDTILDDERLALGELHRLTLELEVICLQLSRETAKEILERRSAREDVPFDDLGPRIVNQSA